MNDLPLFPLGTVLFPGGLLPLRIFEQRYLGMAKACLRDEAPFGVCRIREGAGHGGWKEMGEDNVRMAEWIGLHLLGKQPAKPFNNAVSKLPSTTPAKK